MHPADRSVGLPVSRVRHGSEREIRQMRFGRQPIPLSAPRGASCEPRPLSSDLVYQFLFSSYSVFNELVPLVVELGDSQV